MIRMISFNCVVSVCVDFSWLMIEREMDSHSDNHVSFVDVEAYLPSKTTRVKKQNFRKACEPFSLLNGQLLYKAGTNRLLSRGKNRGSEVKNIFSQI